MNQRDELAQDIRAVDGSHSLGAGELAERLTERGWSRPRVVETIEQLVELPVGAVVLTEQGGVYEARSTVPYQTWRETGSRYVHTPADLALPATVLYLPEEQP
ncbi:hypothetical protein [Prescottella equi]|uniref:hypothetical protein n=1 Tax=Rhodococcus hoagii TaxID=43767 RepID=UPI00111C1510|nr:hypothetical protein [Prescottella equi]